MAQQPPQRILDSLDGTQKIVLVGLMTFPHVDRLHGFHGVHTYYNMDGHRVRNEEGAIERNGKHCQRTRFIELITNETRQAARQTQEGPTSNGKEIQIMNQADFFLYRCFKCFFPRSCVLTIQLRTCTFRFHLQDLQGKGS